METFSVVDTVGRGETIRVKGIIAKTRSVVRRHVAANETAGF